LGVNKKSSLYAFEEGSYPFQNF